MMARRYFLMILTAMLVTAGTSVAMVTEEFNGRTMEAGSIVVIRQDVSMTKGVQTELDRTAAEIAVDIEVRSSLETLQKWQVRGDIEENLDLLNAIPGVTAFPNYLVEISELGTVLTDPADSNTPDDPLFPYQWGLENRGDAEDSLQALFGVSELSSSTAGADIDMLRAWAYFDSAAVQTPEEVLVVVFDSGIDMTHPDLAERMWTNPLEVDGNGIDDDGNGYVDDVHGYNVYWDNGTITDVDGHGTAVAGIIAAASGNGEGISGIAPNVKLVSVKLLDADGYFSTFDIFHGFHYVSALQRSLLAAGADQKIVAVNHSWGDYLQTDYINDLHILEQTSNYAAEQGAMGISWICSSGNYGLDLDEVRYVKYPAGLQTGNILSIGATDYLDEPAYFSNTGFANVDLGAPGLEIVAAMPGGGYMSFSGTSASAPFTAGVYALARGLYPDEDPCDTGVRLMAATDRLESCRDSWMTGGRLNAYQALNPASSGRGVIANTDLLRFQCMAEEEAAVGIAGFVNTSGAAISVGQVTVDYSDGAMESRVLDLGDRELTVKDGEAFGFEVRLPAEEICAGPDGFSRSGVISMAGVGNIPFTAFVFPVEEIPEPELSSSESEPQIVPWGTEVRNTYTLYNRGSIDMEFLLYPVMYYYSDEISEILESLNKVPNSSVSGKTDIKEMEEQIARNNDLILNSFDRNNSPVIDLRLPKGESDGLTEIWSDSLNDAAAVAENWEIRSYGSGEDWALVDVDTSSGENNVFLFGDLSVGYSANSLTAAITPIFNMAEFMESTRQIPMYLKFDYAADMAGGDVFYVNLISSESGRLALLTSTHLDLDGHSDSVKTVYVDISHHVNEMAIGGGVQFFFITNTDSTVEEGFGTMVDNMSILFGDPIVRFEDGAGNGLVDGTVGPAGEQEIVEILNTAALPELYITLYTRIITSQIYLYHTSYIESHYGHLTMNASSEYAGSYRRGETVRETVGLVNDGLALLEYKAMMWLDYKGYMGNVLFTPPRSETVADKSPSQLDCDAREASFRDRLANSEDRPQVTMTPGTESVLPRTLMPVAENTDGPELWMEDFESSDGIPETWSMTDHSYGLGSVWTVDSVQTDTASWTQALVLGDLEAGEYYNDTSVELFSPWLSIDNNDTTDLIIEFNYSVMLEQGWDYIDIYLVEKPAGAPDNEIDNITMIATNDALQSYAPVMVKDTEIHTLSQELNSSTFHLDGKDICLVIVVITDRSINQGYALLDDFRIYSSESSSFLTNSEGFLSPGEEIELLAGLKNTEFMAPGDYTAGFGATYRYYYDSLYTEQFGGIRIIKDMLEQPTVSFTLENSLPVITPDTLYMMEGEITPWVLMEMSLLMNDYDADAADTIRIIDHGEPYFGAIRNLWGEEFSDFPYAVNYIAPFVPADHDLIYDGFLTWISDGWDLFLTETVIAVVRHPQLIRTSQNVFPVNEDDSLDVDLMRLAAGLNVDGVSLAWEHGEELSITMMEDRPIARVKPAPDFFGTVVTDLYMTGRGYSDNMKVTFVVNSVNDLPIPSMEIHVDNNTVSFRDLSTDMQDRDGTLMRRSWDFGDGGKSEEKDPVHVYTEIGDYTVTLTVLDNAGAMASMDTVITVTTVVGLADGDGAIPDHFALRQNHPNPFNPMTTIGYELPEASDVRIDLYDLNGRKVRSLVNSHQDAGYYNLILNASELSSGVYFYRIQAADFRDVKKCLFLK